ncbi:hypothetical protein H4V97_002115 [Flavobacterium sp. CG_23.5]|uniref:hypothetical protein n=1 Tax=unclassified Flavobacterium TaxID=196869 RepID=UPI0018CA4D88|nr:MULTISPECIES: hypothetical protein [unclassified Flavobacterium]MBG6110862.1 hypothetical protein [Flavobacterium sp. CG_9.10]MBP2283797.1 hypothetical protein [Flavobacterium sp. CG_23.5]
MKRIASLFLLATLFYNVLGYYAMFAYQKEQTWVSNMEKMPSSELQVIQLNASLYSFVEDTDFEYVNENVIINNKSYHIFKKRIQNNILSLYYLRNSYGDVIGKDLKEIVDNQLFNSAPSKEGPSKKLLKSFLPDYIPNSTICVDFSAKTDLNSIALIITPNKALDSGYLSLSYTPPDVA